MTKLLVIRFSAMGDVAIAVPVIKALAEQYPDLDITMLSRKQWEPMFIHMPKNVHFIGADLKHKHHGTDGLRLLLQEIDYTRFDLIADFHAILRSFYLDFHWLCKGKRVVCVSKERWRRWLLSRRWYTPTQSLPSVRLRYLEVLKRLGYPVVMPEADFTTPANERKNIGIAPFAAHKGKIYPLEKMQQVVRILGKELSRRGEKVLLFGAGPQEKAVLERWAHSYKGVVSMVGKLPLDEDIETMSGLRLMLTMDSGNMHLASLAGTRCMSIWGATHIHAGFLAYGQQEADCIQRDLPCRPCSTYGKKPCRFKDWRCLDIKPEEIVAKVLTVYES